MGAEARRRTAKDAVIAVLSVAALFIFFTTIDAFDLLYETTRAHEDWELDEAILLVFALPLPLSWFAYRRWRDAIELSAIRLAMERELSHARKIESLGALAGGMAHEINNHLVPILGMTELLMMNEDKESQTYRRLELVNTAAARTQNTVAKVLRFARREEMSGSACDLSEVMPDLIGVLEISCPSRIKMTIDVAENIGTVAISSDELESIVVNLFSNAIAAMDGGHGTLDINVDAVASENCSAGVTLPPGRLARISVRDTGEGISETIKKRIFEPFFTTKDVGKGTGLGLAQVSGIVKSAGGVIDVQSELGAGSTMTVYLPVQ